MDQYQSLESIGAGDLQTTPYRCPHCHDWHLGHDARQSKRGKFSTDGERALVKALQAGARATRIAGRPRRR